MKVGKVCDDLLVPVGVHFTVLDRSPRKLSPAQMSFILFVESCTVPEEWHCQTQAPSYSVK